MGVGDCAGLQSRPQSLSMSASARLKSVKVVPLMVSRTLREYVRFVCNKDGQMHVVDLHRQHKNTNSERGREAAA